MKPVRNQVLLKPFPADEISEGGIFVPESARKVSNKLKVIAVGGGTNKTPMKRVVGETVYRVKDWGCEVMIDGELHFLMDANSLIAKE